MEQHSIARGLSAYEKQVGLHLFKGNGYANTARAKSIVWFVVVECSRDLRSVSEDVTGTRGEWGAGGCDQR